MTVLEEKIVELTKEVKELKTILVKQDKDVISQAGLCRLWRLQAEKVPIVMRFLESRGIRLGSRVGRNWKINKQKALDVMVLPDFEEALEWIEEHKGMR